MTTLKVRTLEPELVARLERRAAAHGRSAEAELHEILRAALAPEMSGEQLFAMLREGPYLPAEADPASWRFEDRGEPAEL